MDIRSATGKAQTPEIAAWWLLNSEQLFRNVFQYTTGKVEGSREMK